MADKFATKKNEGVAASSLFALDSQTGHSKIYDELCDIVDRVSYSGVLNAEDATDEYPDAVDVEFVVTSDSDDSAPYSVMVYIYGKEENDENSQLSYTVRDEYNNNLKGYISAAQGAPLGYQKGYKISELSQMWDDIEKDIQTLVSNADPDESKKKEAKTPMELKKITAADFNAAVKKLTTSDASVWWKTLGTTEDGTELCFVMGWNDGFDPDENLYQQDGYTLCSKIGYKHSDLMVMDYSDFYMPYDKKSGNVWDTDMSVGKGKVTDDSFDVKWYNDEAEAIWKKYGKPDREGNTALDLMESKKKEAKKHTCSMQKKKESLAKKNESSLDGLRVSDEDVAIVIHDIDRFDDRFDDSMIPGDGEEFTLPEFRQLVGDLAETSNGFATVSRDGANIRVAIEVPQENDEGELTDQYKEELVLSGTARIHDDSLDRVADYLNDYRDHR